MSTQGASNLSPLIDSFAALKEQIDTLTDQCDVMREELKTLGAGTHQGEKFLLSIIESGRDVLDMAAVHKKLKTLLDDAAYSRFIKANTKRTNFLMLKVGRKKQIKTPEMENAQD